MASMFAVLRRPRVRRCHSTPPFAVQGRVRRLCGVVLLPFVAAGPC